MRVEPRRTPMKTTPLVYRSCMHACMHTYIYIYTHLSLLHAYIYIICIHFFFLLRGGGRQKDVVQADIHQEQLHHTAEALGSSLSTRLRHPQCRKERYRRLFFPAAVTQRSNLQTQNLHHICQVQFGHK